LTRERAPRLFDRVGLEQRYRILCDQTPVLAIDPAVHFLDQATQLVDRGRSPELHPPRPDPLERSLAVERAPFPPDELLGPPPLLARSIEVLDRLALQWTGIQVATLDRLRDSALDHAIDEIHVDTVTRTCDRPARHDTMVGDAMNWGGARR
jgi:hypothetical protein